MDPKKRRKLRAMGGRVTTVKESLGLTPAEAAVVELRLQLAEAIRKRRIAAGLTQAGLAKVIGCDFEAAERFFTQSLQREQGAGNPEVSSPALPVS